VGPEPEPAHMNHVAHNGRLRWLNWRVPLA
jgi:hypothetical protein